MKHHLERRYGLGHLHFITCSCCQRRPLLSTPQTRDLFLKLLSRVRDEFDFALLGYVVMPEHVHLLTSEPNLGTPSDVMKVLKERVSRTFVKASAELLKSNGHFWQRRFYDFNVWSHEKKNEKLNYMHFNPVRRGLVEKPGDWPWSSCLFYAKGVEGLCRPNPEWKCTEKPLIISRRPRRLDLS